MVLKFDRLLLSHRLIAETKISVSQPRIGRRDEGSSHSTAD